MTIQYHVFFIIIITYLKYWNKKLKMRNSIHPMLCLIGLFYDMKFTLFLILFLYVKKKNKNVHKLRVEAIN